MTSGENTALTFVAVEKKENFGCPYFSFAKRYTYVSWPLRRAFGRIIHYRVLGHQITESRNPDQGYFLSFL